ncbi:hypothetical protein NEHOM01_0300 [Nematocida homosporus]|uniref:uncharacterized protein n=1 Tax=Nematocida homosporus TaxID=1912981 RepID=UPI002221293C|nr:uncharacterized protein NEHOM01_0300 [Nematocida homosporus]KAI5184625.1 hypothetical protein NEHOM01_0300 [Nematocida homosporus]
MKDKENNHKANGVAATDVVTTGCESQFEGEIRPDNKKSASTTTTGEICSYFKHLSLAESGEPHVPQNRGITHAEIPVASSLASQRMINSSLTQPAHTTDLHRVSKVFSDLCNMELDDDIQADIVALSPESKLALAGNEGQKESNGSMSQNLDSPTNGPNKPIPKTLAPARFVASIDQEVTTTPPHGPAFFVPFSLKTPTYINLKAKKSLALFENAIARLSSCLSLIFRFIMLGLLVKFEETVLPLITPTTTLPSSMCIVLISSYLYLFTTFALSIYRNYRLFWNKPKSNEACHNQSHLVRSSSRVCPWYMMIAAGDVLFGAILFVSIYNCLTVNLDSLILEPLTMQVTKDDSVWAALAYVLTLGFWNCLYLLLLSREIYGLCCYLGGGRPVFWHTHRSLKQVWISWSIHGKMILTCYFLPMKLLCAPPTIACLGSAAHIWFISVLVFQSLATTSTYWAEMCTRCVIRLIGREAPPMDTIEEYLALKGDFFSIKPYIVGARLLKCAFIGGGSLWLLYGPVLSVATEELRGLSSA